MNFTLCLVFGSGVIVALFVVLCEICGGCLVEVEALEVFVVCYNASYVPPSSGVVHDVDIIFIVEGECCYAVVICIKHVSLVVLVEIFFRESSADEEFFCVHFWVSFRSVPLGGCFVFLVVGVFSITGVEYESVTVS